MADGTISGDANRFDRILNQEGWPETFGGKELVILITTLNTDKHIILNYMNYHKLFDQNVSICPEMKEVVTAYTKMLATLAHYRDSSEANHYKMNKGDVNMEVIKDTVELENLWQEASATLQGGKAKKQRTEMETEKTDEGETTPEEQEAKKKVDEAEKEETKRLTMQVKEDVGNGLKKAEQERLTKVSTMDKENMKRKDICMVGILPTSRCDMDRNKRSHANRMDMLDCMYNAGEPLSWYDAMKAQNMYINEKDIEIDEQVKMLVITYLRTLQEHMGVVTEKLDDIRTECGMWEDPDPGMNIDENLQLYEWPQTLGRLLEQVSNMSERMMTVYEQFKRVEPVGKENLSTYRHWQTRWLRENAT